jgi:hypothetical protein
MFKTYLNRQAAKTAKETGAHNENPDPIEFLRIGGIPLL